VTLEESVKRLIFDNADIPPEVIEATQTAVDQVTDPDSRPLPTVTVPPDALMQIMVARVNGLALALILIAQELDRRA